MGTGAGSADIASRYATSGEPRSSLGTQGEPEPLGLIASPECGHKSRPSVYFHNDGGVDQRIRICILKLRITTNHRRYERRYAPLRLNMRIGAAA